MDKQKNMTFLMSGCLLRAIPSDVIEDKSSGISFTCDLNDNIAAPWPSSSSQSSFSLCGFCKLPILLYHPEGLCRFR
jgi:hypothetical protein